LTALKTAKYIPSPNDNKDLNTQLMDCDYLICEPMHRLWADTAPLISTEDFPAELD
jgi:hypothetical protein